MLGSAFTPIVFLFIIGATTSLWLWHSANNDISKELDNVYVQGFASIEDTLNKRVAGYEQLIQSGAGLFAASGNNVTSAQWIAYTQNLNPKVLYPGLITTGYIENIAPENLQAHIDSVRAQGDQSYTVYPTDTPRDDYTAIQFYEPRAGQTTNVIGFDMTSDPIRKTSMDRARDTGQPTMTDPLYFVKDSKAGKPGFILFQAIYNINNPTTTEQRRQNLNGYVFATVRIEDLFNGIFSSQTADKSAIYVYQGTKEDSDHQIFKTQNADEFIKSSKLVVRSKEMHVKDQVWTLQAYATNDLLLTNSKRGQPLLLLTVGLLSTLLLCIFLIFVMRTRTRELSYLKQIEVQSAKDELLSLASHQLRTPATGVKQYIGMVLQGYAGKITDEQREMLDKAQSSNERQLEIVNQILHVTKLEAGTVSLKNSKVDLKALIKDIIDEQGDMIRARKHKVIFNLRRPLYIQGNEQYLRMVLENLLSNAVKYMRDKGRVIIDITQTKDAVVITVADNGVGIAEEDIPKLFQKFSRIDNELSVQAGGSGIGLYISKLIVILHGGTIDVASKEGVGTTFQVTLPKPR